MLPKTAPNGRAYINVGCGRCFSPDWNNLDLTAEPGVIQHNVLNELPYDAGVFDAAYSSHVLEHLAPPQGAFFLREQFRVLKPGGVCRVAVPDLERIARDYLARLDDVVASPTQSHLLDYHWTLLMLIDQQVREETGGETRKALETGNFNLDFVRSRCGDEFNSYLDKTSQRKPATLKSAIKARLRPLVQKARRTFHLEPPPRKQGEVHRWMYDRVSLRRLMDTLGFIDFAVVTHDQSRIPDWDQYRLDTSTSGPVPRKPDSLFAEALKPG